MPAYSFLDVGASIVGPGGVVNIGAGSGAAEEGIEYDFEADRNTMTTGADGFGMHSLGAGRSGTFTLRLLKTTPTNSNLTRMFNLQSTSSALWGSNVIRIMDFSRGDVISGRQAAFRRLPANNYQRVGNILQWSWHAIYIDVQIGVGTPEILAA